MRGGWGKRGGSDKSPQQKEEQASSRLRSRWVGKTKENTFEDKARDSVRKLHHVRADEDKRGGGGAVEEEGQELSTHGRLFLSGITRPVS